MEVRQLRYFVAVSEELHFGRAAQREHIVQSALSQQIGRLEREMGVRLLDRDTHHVELTPAGSAFLSEARLVLMALERASTIARRAAEEPAVLRVGTSPGYQLPGRILGGVQGRHPDLEVHQIEATVSQQYGLLTAGELDVGVGYAIAAPDAVASQVFQRDAMGVVLGECHPLAHAEAVTVRQLEPESLLFGRPGQTPEHDDLVVHMCRDAGFTPTVYRGSVQSVIAGVGLVRALRCAMCLPQSLWHEYSGVRWRPLTQPETTYPWSVLWRTDDQSPVVRSFVSSTGSSARVDLSAMRQPVGRLSPEVIAQS
jgi:DNA-binding transcriptional LysR family regulator